MITSALQNLLGLTIPILNAPMTPQAGGALARAVSEAGGFGMLGFDEDEGEESIAAQVAIVGTEPRVPFGIGLVAWVLQRSPQLLDMAIQAQPRFISISFGDPSPYERRVHDAGILLGAQVQSRASARVALEAGVDILTAQGTEAGGHTGSAVGTLPLLQILLDMTDKPVLAAGGIATGRGVVDWYAISACARSAQYERGAGANRGERRNANNLYARVRSRPAQRLASRIRRTRLTYAFLGTLDWT
jgi:nitronate monooxygenase